MSEGHPLLQVQHLQWCELEVALRAVDQPAEDKPYYVFVRFSRPNDVIDTQLPSPPPVRFDHKRLAERKGDPLAYGKALWAMLFESAQMQKVLGSACDIARALHLALRLRLFIGHDAPELHGIWWETLVDPATGTPVLMREDFVFSRYLDSMAGMPVEPEPAHRLRVLYAAANPVDIDDWTVNGRVLGRPDPDGQWLPDDAADQLEVTRLGGDEPVTLDNLVARLHERFDILYLVCHGALAGGQSRLYLENDRGMTAVVDGELLVARLRDMAVQPRLVVLASCQSAGTGAAAAVGDDGELAALGPRLMDAGVPAVIAMQGNITQSSVRRFMPVLFEHLSRHGQIDRAMAVARDAVRQERDWWMPVLFMRLKTGALWYTPALAPDSPAPDQAWKKLVGDLNTNMSVMVLGSGLGEDVLGSTRAIASAWMEEYKFPMVPQARDGLPQVSQYLACTRNRNFPLMQLRKYLIKSLWEKHAALLEDYCGTVGAPDELDALVREIGSRLRERFENRKRANRMALAEGNEFGVPVALPYPDLVEPPYVQIARLPVSTYVTTNRDNLLLDSLRAEGRRPEMVVCRWKPILQNADAAVEPDWPASVFEREPGYKPSYERPLVYHVFGNTKYPHTVVLTEDDYFDFLVGLSRNQGNPRTSMPPHVKMVLATHGLMFLGFQFDDWEFRAMFRGVLPREGIEAGDRHSNIAVQVKPDDEHMRSPEDARGYMSKYFSQHRKIQVYWGKSEEFLTELTKQWKSSKP